MTFLQVLWFILIAVLWTGYLVLEGFDLGAGMWLRILGKNDKERSQIIATFGPVWDGNEVWLLTAGGATFAAFAPWYATMFSGMYLALFLVLLALIVRIGAIEWRKKIDSESWRNRWDWAHTISAWLVPILLGTAFGNLVGGMAIEMEELNGQQVYVLTGGPDAFLKDYVDGFFTLLWPFNLVGGVVITLLFLTQGALFLCLKTTGDVQARAQAVSGKVAIAGTAVTAVWALWAQFAKTSQPIWGWIPLVITALLLIAATGAALVKKNGLAFILHSASLAGAVAFVFTSMAPYVMKSYLDPAYSMSIEYAANTEGTLLVMTIVAIILVPIVLAYTGWAYWVMRDPINLHDVREGGLDPKRIRIGANFLSEG